MSQNQHRVSSIGVMTSKIRRLQRGSGHPIIGEVIAADYTTSLSISSCEVWDEQ